MMVAADHPRDPSAHFTKTNFQEYYPAWVLLCSVSALLAVAIALGTSGLVYCVLGFMTFVILGRSCCDHDKNNLPNDELW